MVIGNQNSHSGLSSIFDTRKLRLSQNIAAEFVTGALVRAAKNQVLSEPVFSR
jgi:hypothetical protein